MVDLPVGLAGPVDFELAQAVEALPGEKVLPGGSRYEPKWDGFRAGAVVRDGKVRLWSRNGKEFTDKFPDVVGALEAQLRVDCVLDGELVVWADERLDFDALQRRMVNTAATVRRRLGVEEPASFVAFDVLAVDGVDIRNMRWSIRRRRLESLAENWRPPLQLSPATADIAEAREWMEVFRAAGVEGLVVKGASSRYVAGRSWVKYKTRETVEVIAGGVIGPLKQPEVLIAGRYRGSELVQVGRTVPLSPEQSAALGAVLRKAKRDHPWPDEIGTGRWGGKSGKVALTKVDPVVVVEVSADAALQAGQWRHPLRMVRIRAEMQPEDVATLPDPAVDA
jgi:ATP-dependent DNA ligase